MKTPKILKVIYNGEFLCNVYPHASKWQVFKYKLAMLVRKVLIGSFILGASYGMFMAGRVTTEPVKVYADKEVIVKVKGKASVMDRIAKCESGGKHFKDNGDVVYGYNKNGSIDVGKYQINTIHIPLAGKLGFDINKEKDNEAMAYYLYETNGTEPWYSSKSCWSK